MKALELANKQALYVGGELGSETAAELRRLAEVNAELLGALEACATLLEFLKPEIRGGYSEDGALAKARSTIAKEKEQQ